MTEKLRVGVIGVGFIGGLHARIFAEDPCAELVAVSDLNEELLNSVAAKYGCDAYSDYEELLKRDDIDAVSICVQEDFHVPVAKAAAKAKKDILIEKPIAKTKAEALEIKEACEENGVRLMVEHVLHFDPRYVQLYDEVKKGAIGDISQIFVKRQNPRTTAERLGGKVSFFYYMSVHDIEWMLCYANSRPVKVYCQVSNVINSHLQGFDTAYALVNFENGAIGCINVDWSLPKNDAVGIFSAVELVGTKGMGLIDIRNQGIEIVTNDAAFFPDALHWPEYNGKIQGDLKEALNHFVQATLNEEPYAVDTEKAIGAVEIIDALFQSIETGMPVML